MNSTAIYVHLPWCVKKCPYCDFNSHQLKEAQGLPESEYIDRLARDLEEEKQIRGPLNAHSIFFGGGTPSLFSAAGIARIIQLIDGTFPMLANTEITLETNPGTFEYEKFKGYLEAGVNRLSIGVQSFDDLQLKRLGRIHSSQNARDAIEAAKRVGFSNFNIDIMHGLPSQSISQAIIDLETALALEPMHISWYQLTIETNTEFFSNPPKLPDIDSLDDIEMSGFSILSRAGFNQYEVSAWARNQKRSRHNLSYWNFEDYVGIGAGAHGKYSKGGRTFRRQKTRLPEHYLDSRRKLCSKEWEVETETLVFEYLLNRLRLFSAVSINEYETATRTSFSDRLTIFSKLEALGLMKLTSTHFELTPRGQRFLNNVLNEFLPE